MVLCVGLIWEEESLSRTLPKVSGTSLCFTEEGLVYLDLYCKKARNWMCKEWKWMFILTAVEYGFVMQNQSHQYWDFCELIVVPIAVMLVFFFLEPILTIWFVCNFVFHCLCKPTPLYLKSAFSYCGFFKPYIRACTHSFVHSVRS